MHSSISEILRVNFSCRTRNMISICLIFCSQEAFLHLSMFSHMLLLRLFANSCLCHPAGPLPKADNFCKLDKIPYFCFFFFFGLLAVSFRAFLGLICIGSSIFVNGLPKFVNFVIFAIFLVFVIFVVSSRAFYGLNFTSSSLLVHGLAKYFYFYNFQSCNFCCFVEGLPWGHLHFLITFRLWPCKILLLFVILAIFVARNFRCLVEGRL